MSPLPVIRRNHATAAEVEAHLRHCSADFVRRLSERVALADYAQKLAEQSERFEAWAEDRLVGLVAIYCNRPEGGTAFITSVSVLPSWQKRGIAARLVEAGIAHAHGLGFPRVELEVDRGNAAALALYQKAGFSPHGERNDGTIMRLDIDAAR